MIQFTSGAISELSISCLAHAISVEQFHLVEPKDFNKSELSKANGIELLYIVNFTR